MTDDSLDLLSDTFGDEVPSDKIAQAVYGFLYGGEEEPTKQEVRTINRTLTSRQKVEMDERPTLPHTHVEVARSFLIQYCRENGWKDVEGEIAQDIFQYGPWRMENVEGYEEVVEQMASSMAEGAEKLSNATEEGEKDGQSGRV